MYLGFLGCLGFLGVLGLNVTYAKSHALHWTQEYDQKEGLQPIGLYEG